MAKPKAKREYRTPVESFLFTRKSTCDAAGDLVRRLKPRARLLLPSRFPNAACIARYAKRLRAPDWELAAVPAVYHEYRQHCDVLTHGDGYIIHDLRFYDKHPEQFVVVDVSVKGPPVVTEQAPVRRGLTRRPRLPA